jgi:hypothetical protein
MRHLDTSVEKIKGYWWKGKVNGVDLFEAMSIIVWTLLYESVKAKAIRNP